MDLFVEESLLYQRHSKYKKGEKKQKKQHQWWLWKPADLEFKGERVKPWDHSNKAHLPAQVISSRWWGHHLLDFAPSAGKLQHGCGRHFSCLSEDMQLQWLLDAVTERQKREQKCELHLHLR